jgi:hypothetical protein
MSQAAVHRAPARFDASVVPGAKPAPFPGFVEPSHLLLSPSLKNRLVAGGVAREVRTWEKTSDHAPAWVELEDIAPIRFRKKGRD